MKLTKTQRVILEKLGRAGKPVSRAALGMRWTTRNALIRNQLIVGAGAIQGERWPIFLYELTPAGREVLAGNL